MPNRNSSPTYRWAIALHTLEKGEFFREFVKWYRLYSLNDFYNREEAFKKGIFAISRVYAKNETLIYIGKIKRSFIQKIWELNKDWIFDESELKITLGIIEFPSGESYFKKKVKEIKLKVSYVQMLINF